MARFMLTTTDNPFSPVTQFKEWDTWDRAHGYCTLAYQARIGFISDELSEADLALAIDDAQNEILEIHADGLYRKVPVPG
jgi:hypothetical protein